MASDAPIWFWQRIVSPHMADLAKALAAMGRQVVYVAEREMSEERRAQGWSAPEPGAVDIRYAPTGREAMALLAGAPANVVHICQGIRQNGIVSLAQQMITAQGLRYWIVMETVDDQGLRGALKRVEYRRLFTSRRRHFEGVLATGYRTRDWIAGRGVRREAIFPFAYFLPDSISQVHPAPRTSPEFRILFVGQLTERKRLKLLFDALALLLSKRHDKPDLQVTVAGTGPLDQELRAEANKKIPGRVNWVGKQQMEEVPRLMIDADCLVLPSRHDGWGAVVSEAMMVGTPVVCSDTCGAAGVVWASGTGGVFRSGDVADLAQRIEHQVTFGPWPVERRQALATWAQCLGARAGAQYLCRILDYLGGSVERPLPPWETQEISL